MSVNFNYIQDKNSLMKDMQVSQWYVYKSTDKWFSQQAVLVWNVLLDPLRQKIYEYI